MSVTQASFVEQLLAEVPEAGGLVSEHFSDQDGESLLDGGPAEIYGPGFSNWAICSGSARLEGDKAVENAVAVSFVENVGLGDGETPAFFAMSPPGLVAEKARQEAWTPGT